VGSYETFDTQVAYRGIRNVRLSLGVKNIMDRDPPYTNAGGQFAAGYDITYADVRGGSRSMMFFTPSESLTLRMPR